MNAKRIRKFVIFALFSFLYYNTIMGGGVTYLIFTTLSGFAFDFGTSICVNYQNESVDQVASIGEVADAVTLGTSTDFCSYGESSFDPRYQYQKVGRADEGHPVCLKKTEYVNYDLCFLSFYIP